MPDVNEDLISALAETARPIVRRLLALGVPFGRVETRLRELFIEVADTALAIPGRPQTDSRIALVTGINRKEVRRIRSADRSSSAPKSFSMNPATTLISRWLSDPATTDRRGKPRPLPYQAPRGPSFMKLARKVTGDLAPRVLLDELVRAGAVELRDEGVVALLADAYVPKLSTGEGLQILAEDPPELVETILRNVLAESRDRLLQRKVYYDNLGTEAAASVRAELRREGEAFLRKVDRLLARHDRDRNPRAAGGTSYYAGIGVYVFERPAEPERAKASPPRVGGRYVRSKERE